MKKLSVNTTILDPNIPYFIFVDSATNSMTNETVLFRAEFESCIAKKFAENGQEIPIIELVLGGSVKTLTTVKQFIDNYQTPCVFIESCKESSEFFSFFIKKENENKQIFTEKLVKEKISDCFNYLNDEEKKEMFKLATSILKSENRHCISICRENDNLDKVIIKALSKLDKETKLHELTLALTWNRIDLAKENLGNSNQINIVRFMFISNCIYRKLLNIKTLVLIFSLFISDHGTYFKQIKSEFQPKPSK